MADVIADVMGVIWVQPDGPNTQSYPLFCYNVDSYDAALGDVTTALCLNAKRQWETVHRSQGGPSRATFTLEAYLEKTRDWLQKQIVKRCPMGMYVHWSDCGNADYFLGYQFGQAFHNAYITGESKGNMVLRKGEEGQTATPSGRSYEVSADPQPPEYWPLVVARRTTAEAEPIRDLTFCDAAQCEGACGAAADICTDGMYSSDNTGAAVAEVWYSNDGLANSVVGGAIPFAVSVAAGPIECFASDTGVMRTLIGQATSDAAHMKIAYSDSATLAAWSAAIDVGAVDTEYFIHGGAINALDYHHIWACSNKGNIYFSSDGGVTWTDQGAPEPTPAEALYCIDFIDDKYGMCVGGTTGASCVVLTTTDGGDHWTLQTGVGAHMLTGVSVIDPYRAWACSDTGELWYTSDFGVTWTQRTLPTAAVSLGDVEFLDAYNGACTGTRATLLPVVYRTVDGGYNWEMYSYTALDGAVETFGMNSVHMCDPNHIYAVGEVAGALGLILDLSAKGSV